MTNVVVRPILEPQRKQTKRVLQCILIPESDGVEEPSDGRHDMCCELMIGDIADLVVLLVLKESDHLKVGQRPSVPCLVPGRIVMRRQVIRLEDVLDVALSSWCQKQSLD